MIVIHVVCFVTDLQYNNIFYLYLSIRIRIYNTNPHESILQTLSINLHNNVSL